MEERRKSKRTSLESKLIIKRLGPDASVGPNQEVAIEILDVSKSGVGFSCPEALAIGEVYESFLTIWTKEVLHAFIQIVRIEMNGQNGFIYGASFVGLPEMEASRIEVYQTINEK